MVDSAQMSTAKSGIDPSFKFDFQVQFRGLDISTPIPIPRTNLASDSGGSTWLEESVRQPATTEEDVYAYTEELKEKIALIQKHYPDAAVLQRHFRRLEEGIEKAALGMIHHDRTRVLIDRLQDTLSRVSVAGAAQTHDNMLKELSLRRELEQLQERAMQEGDNTLRFYMATNLAVEEYRRRYWAMQKEREVWKDVALAWTG